MLVVINLLKGERAVEADGEDKQGNVGWARTLGLASGSVMGPFVRSKTGQAFLSMMQGEVFLASLYSIHMN